MIKRFGVTVWYFLVAAVIGLAVLLSVARVLLPNMSEYKSNLEALASEQIGRVIEVGSLSAGWSGLSPVLALEQVSISSQDRTDDTVRIKEIHLSLDLWQSLLTQRWKMRSIDLVGLKLTVYRLIDGHWSLSESRDEDSQPPDLELVLQQNRLGLRDAQITWVDQMEGGLTRNFHDVEAQLINAGYKHRFSMRTVLPVSLGKSLELIGEAKGYGADFAHWSGQIFCKIEDLQLRQWTRWIPDLPVSAKGLLSAEFWGDWSGAQLTALSGKVSGTDLNLAMTGSGRQPYELEKLKSRFEWQKTDQGWRINADEIDLYRNQFADWSGIKLGALWHQSNRQLKLSASLVPLEELGLISTQFVFLDARLRRWVDRLEPRGLLHAFELVSRLPDDFETPQLSVRAEFSDLSVQAFDNFPGITGLAGRLEGNLQQGQLHLDSDALVVLAPALFSDPKILVEAVGDINWRRYADRVLVNTPQLRLATAEGIKLKARGQLDWVFSEPAPLLDLQLRFNDFGLEKVQHYLPVGIMSPKLVDWLSTALVSGTVTSPRILFNGRVDQMPFDHGEGVFLTYFGLEEAVLDYSPEWGKLDGLTGTAEFTGRTMHIRGERARLMRAALSDTVVKIDDLANAVLTVKGKAQDSVAGMLNYVMTTPLRNRFGPLVEAVETRGKAGLELDLKIPLKKKLGKVKVSGDVTFKNSRIKSRQDAFDLSAIKGKLHFTEQVLSASNIEARLFNAPVSVGLYGGAGTSRATVLDIRGPMQLVEQIQSFGWRFADYLSGNAQWQTRLFFKRDEAAGRTDISIRLDSDMQGIVSGLPAPLKKPADKSVPLTVEWDVNETPGSPVYIKYGDKASAVFAGDGAGGIRAGEAVFGGEPAKLPKHNVFKITGRVAEVVPLDWAAIFTGGASKSSHLPRLDFSLRADKLSLFEYSVNDVFVKSPASSPWEFTLSGDAAEGSLQLVFGEGNSLQAVKAQLERLHLIPPPEKPSQQGREIVHPDTIPDLSISIGDLRWGEPVLGRLILETSSVSDGIDIEQLQLTSDALAVTANGQWKETGAVQATRFDIKINGGTLGQLLTEFGDSDAIEKGELSGTITAAWPGSPADFSLKTLEGELVLKVGDGRLKDVDTGAGRLLGLLSLQSIPRRLFLDFSDLFNEGYSFDKLEGSFLFNDGDAFTKNLKIYGPAADIEVIGRTGLITQDYDELITVIPHLTSALPIAGVIAGGPGVGAAILLAERIIGDQVNKMSKIQYQVTGSWKDPQYTRFENSEVTSGEPKYGDDE